MPLPSKPMKFSLPKALSLLLVAAMPSLFAQQSFASISNGGTNPFYKLPSDGMFHNDRITIKVLPELRSMMLSDPKSIKEFDAIMQRWGVTKVEQRFKGAQIPGTFKTVGDVKPADLTLIFSVFVPAMTDIESVINEFIGTGLVEYAEITPIDKVARVSLNDPLLSTPLSNSTQWIYRVRAHTTNPNDVRTAWDVTNGGDTTVIMAVVDSGVQTDHPDITSNLYINRREIPNNGIDDDNNGFVDDWRGWDFGGANFSSQRDDNNPTITGENNSHGLHVGGIMGAVGNNGIGLAGIAYNCRILAVKASADDDTRGSGGVGLIIGGYEGIAYAGRMGAKVINCSFGGGGRSQASQDVINTATAQGALVVAAAGNDNVGTAQYPAGYNNVLCVAASHINNFGPNNINQRDIKASFSNFQAYVDISAPGTFIRSTYWRSTYQVEQGTSMASPLVAGCAALLFSRFPNMTPAQVEAQLKRTADDMYNTAGTDDVGAQTDNGQFRGQLGTGRVNIYRALTEVSANFTPNIINLVNQNNLTSINRGDTVEVSINLSNLSVFRSTPAAFVRLSVGSPSVRLISSDSVHIGEILGGLSNSYRPMLRFVVDTVPVEGFNPRIQMRVLDRVLGDSFTTINNFVLPINLNRNSIDVGTALIRTTLVGNGRLGFESGFSDGRGIGFTYRGRQLLSEMGILVGVSADSLSDNIRDSARGAGAFSYRNDFNSVIGWRTVRELDNFVMYQSEINDEGNRNTPLGLNITQRCLVSSLPTDTSFIILRYTLKNTTQRNFNNLVIGIYSDWNISTNGARDVGSRIFANAGTRFNMATTVAAGQSNLIAATAVLSRPGVTPIVNSVNKAATPSATVISANDGLTKAEKYRGLTVANTSAGTQASPVDVAQFVSSGMFNLNAGDTTNVDFALMVGNSGSFLSGTVIPRIASLVNGVLTAEEKLNLNQITIYPNPSSGSFTIKLPDNVLGAQILVSDLTGRKILEQNQQAALSSVTLPVGSHGIYLVTVSSGKTLVTKKIEVR